MRRGNDFLARRRGLRRWLGRLLQQEPEDTDEKCDGDEATDQDERSRPDACSDAPLDHGRPATRFRLGRPWREDPEQAEENTEADGECHREHVADDRRRGRAAAIIW